MFDELTLPSTVERMAEQFVVSGMKGNLILFGKKHTGKHTAARLMAERILLSEPGEQLDIHPDFFEISPIGKVIGIEEIRGVLSQSVYRCIKAERKVFIINDANTMTEPAQNAVLKVLEDDADRCTFIFVCHEPLLDTIHSRCTVIRWFSKTSERDDFETLFSGDCYPGRAMAYKDTDFYKFILEFMSRLEMLSDKSELLEILGELKEHDSNRMFEQYSLEEVSIFLNIVETLFVSASIEDTTGYKKPYVEKIMQLYEKTDMLYLAMALNTHRNRVERGSYSKNDFFEIVMKLGG